MNLFEDFEKKLTKNITNIFGQFLKIAFFFENLLFFKPLFFFAQSENPNDLMKSSGLQTSGCG